MERFRQSESVWSTQRYWQRNAENASQNLNAFHFLFAELFKKVQRPNTRQQYLFIRTQSEKSLIMFQISFSIRRKSPEVLNFKRIKVCKLSETPAEELVSGECRQSGGDTDNRQQPFKLLLLGAPLCDGGVF